METIVQAKQFLRENFEKGTECPCCGQFVRKWRHSLNSSIARTLIRMRSIGITEDRDWVHIQKEIGITTMYGIAAYWDLIEAIEFGHIDQLLDDKKSSGMWRLTQKGKDFVDGKITIDRYVRAFDHKRIGFEGGPVTIQDCLGKKFSYNELMGRV